MAEIIMSALLAAAIFVYGSARAARLREKHAQEDGLLSLLGYIKTSVTASGRPIYEILESFYDKSLDECGFLTALRQNDASNPVGYAVERCGKDLFADKDFVSDLKAFSDSLGIARNKAQVKDVCEKYIKELEDKVLKRRKKENSLEELYLKLSPLAAICIFLLLL